jgi:hypothetical protein
MHDDGIISKGINTAVLTEEVHDQLRSCTWSFTTDYFVSFCKADTHTHTIIEQFKVFKTLQTDTSVICNLFVNGGAFVSFGVYHTCTMQCQQTSCLVLSSDRDPSVQSLMIALAVR